MAILAGAKVDAVDYDVPDVVTGYGSGANTVTAASFAALPTFPVTVALTNPHPTANLLCLVSLSAWTSSTANDVRASVDFSGATTIGAGIGGGGAAGWGEVLYNGAAGIYIQQSVTYSVSLAPGATTAKVYAYRTTAGTQQVNYPVLRLTPISYIF